MKANITALLLLLILLPAAALAATEQAQLTTATGQVASVDASAKSLVVKIDDRRGDPRDVTFTLDDESKVVKNGAAISLAEVSPGDSVTVTYRPTGGKNVVVNIGVSSKP